MKKLLNFIVLIGISLLFVSCGNENSIPKQYLGNYELLDPYAKITEQGKIVNNNLDYCIGKASVIEKGNRYIFQIKIDLVAKNSEEWEIKREKEDFIANVKLKEITGEKGQYREEYYTIFTDYKITGYENSYPVSIYHIWNMGKIKVVFEKENGRYLMTINGNRFIKVN